MTTHIATNTADLRDLFGLCLEPGMPFPRAPFAGLTADEIADAFAEEAMAKDAAGKQVARGQP